MKNVLDNSLDEVKSYYDNDLNKNIEHFTSSNDEPTPIGCVEEMLDHIPEDFWKQEDLKILDPCAGNGNFHFAGMQYLLRAGHSMKECLEQILTFNEINPLRVDYINRIFSNTDYDLQISNRDFLEFNYLFDEQYDLVYANPPYAKIMENGKRASKNHTLVRDFIKKAIEMTKPGGYVVFVVPDNWMSFADRNDLISTMTQLQLRWVDIHGAKRWFKKIGSSFTMFVMQNQPSTEPFEVVSHYKKQILTSSIQSRNRRFMPLLMTSEVDSILLKTIESDAPKFEVQTSSDLHKYTKQELITTTKNSDHPFRLIHTPKQTVFASRPHKFQDGYKVFISTTDKYGVFVDNCGMTQSIAFIRVNSDEQATQFAEILRHPLYAFLNDICRWGNFNNIRILQRFPIPSDPENIYASFGLSDEEIELITSFS